jgi:hypothetical protein
MTRRSGHSDGYRGFRPNCIVVPRPILADHRRHAIVEQRIAELKSAGLAHQPSGHFMADAAWLALTVMADNLDRSTHPCPVDEELGEAGRPATPARPSHTRGPPAASSPRAAITWPDGRSGLRPLSCAGQRYRAVLHRAPAPGRHWTCYRGCSRPVHNPAPPNRYRAARPAASPSRRGRTGHSPTARPLTLRRGTG